MQKVPALQNVFNSGVFVKEKIQSLILILIVIIFILCDIPLDKLCRKDHFIRFLNLGVYPGRFKLSLAKCFYITLNNHIKTNKASNLALVIQSPNFNFKNFEIKAHNKSKLIKHFVSFVRILTDLKNFPHLMLASVILPYLIS
ncbi:hypothetical protein BpHYR1_001037 [Brachionus plicatilis]|uniref:Uncharacterized protein n=1 Tax=Brachionus plicatilis TaxID=10195 RepID=A0A3M7QCJ0_BRAPC|nr:hypothetical protein BpHYR1_001037 [Brachionus plicatilis]